MALHNYRLTVLYCIKYLRIGNKFMYIVIEWIHYLLRIIVSLERGKTAMKFLKWISCNSSNCGKRYWQISQSSFIFHCFHNNKTCRVADGTSSLIATASNFASFYCQFRRMFSDICLTSSLLLVWNFIPTFSYYRMYSAIFLVTNYLSQMVENVHSSVIFSFFTGPHCKHWILMTHTDAFHVKTQAIYLCFSGFLPKMDRYAYSNV